MDTTLHTVDVDYDASLTNVDEMKAALNVGGYQVEDVIGPDVPEEAHFDISPLEVKELIETDAYLIILDVREPEEFCDSDGHIPESENYPWTSGVLEQYYTDFPDESSILVVCGSGVRSNQAAEFLYEKGFTVYDMTGGMAEWTWETETCETSEPDDSEELPDDSDIPDDSEPSEPEFYTGSGDGGGGGCFIRAAGFSMFIRQ